MNGMPFLQTNTHLLASMCVASLIGLTIAVLPVYSAENGRNVVIFVADGLRHDSVTAEVAPTMFRIRQKGVHFANSHSLFPTFTTPNASAIATGHYLGDTGDFSNTLYSGYPMFNTGRFGKHADTVTPFIENDQVLADLNEHLGGNYLNVETLLSLARNHGYRTATVGKLGPAAIQDAPQVVANANGIAVPQTIIVDDDTGHNTGIPLSSEIADAIKQAGLPLAAPSRNQPSGNSEKPGTTNTNSAQQDYFVAITTRVILPVFKASRKPFALVYWSRDPDGTQHNQGDSLNSIAPGINGPTSTAAITNADSNLAEILAFIEADPALATNTDIFITSDHGFATISKHEVDSAPTFTKSYSATAKYVEDTGRQEVNSGFLPPGFLAIDLAHLMRMPLYDPDTIIETADKRSYAPVDPNVQRPTASIRQRPKFGNGLIGGTGTIQDSVDAKVVVAANGGSDLIYIVGRDRTTLTTLVNFLAGQDYVDGLFVDDAYGSVAAALPFSTINLKGTTKLPVPSIVVSFKNFVLDPNKRTLTGVQISDSTLQEGQGMHGGFGRNSTFNFMAAIGPDFKREYVDRSPVSNADIVVTLAHILRIDFPHGGTSGRVLQEALTGGPDTVSFGHKVSRSRKGPSGKRTILVYQFSGSRRYFDEACFVTSSRVRRCDSSR